MKETELRPAVLSHLRAQGYVAWADPDGHDYFDIAALRGDEVGLVELKVRAGRQVFGQALRRRAWADWVAVAVPSATTAARLARIREPALAERVGVWRVDGDRVVELRPARSFPAALEEDPFAEAREQLRAMLRRLASGEVGEGIDWGLWGSPRLPGEHRRSTALYRLEEFR